MLALLLGDCRDVLATLPAASVQCCVTSPPYWGQRDYGTPGEIGGETMLADYVARLVAVFRAVRRVLADDGLLWLNLGDGFARKPVGRFNGGGAILAGRDLSGHAGSGSFDTAKGSGLPEKSLIGVPWRVAFALQDDGWLLRSEVIWAKTAIMPESTRDRPSRAREQVFLFAKQPHYRYDAAAVAEPSVTTPGATRNRRSAWTVNPQPYKGAHFAVFPEALVTPCVLAGSRPGDTVIDPFVGSGTVGVVALRHGRAFVGIDLNVAYLELAARRTGAVVPPLATEGAA